MFGAVRCRIQGSSYYIGSPTAFQTFVSNEIYEESLLQAEESGVLSSNEIIDYMKQWGMWTDEEEQQLTDYPDKIEKTKLELYDYQSRPHDFKLCKKRIEIYRNNMMDLLFKKHRFDYVTSEGFASFCKVNYLMGAGLKDANFKPLWGDETFFEDHSGILDEVRSIYNQTRLKDIELRELARTDPWRLYWNTCDKHNMFGKQPIELTDEQKNLLAWSKLYDSVYEAMESPPEHIIEDDDLLDAWLILQRKKRIDKQQESKAENLQISKNPKINNAQNVFIMMGEDVDPLTGKNIQMVRNVEEAKRLDETLSTPELKALKKMRFDAIEKQGTLRHTSLPDVKQDLRMQATNLEIQTKKGKLK